MFENLRISSLAKITVMPGLRRYFPADGDSGLNAYLRESSRRNRITDLCEEMKCGDFQICETAETWGCNVHI